MRSASTVEKAQDGALGLLDAVGFAVQPGAHLDHRDGRADQRHEVRAAGSLLIADGRLLAAAYGALLLLYAPLGGCVDFGPIATKERRLIGPALLPCLVRRLRHRLNIAADKNIF